MNDFTNKVVLITGAGNGLGRELALAFAQAGAMVALNDLTRVNLDPLAEEIKASGGQAEVFDADISKKLALQLVASDVVEAFDRIDVLVNHASVQPHESVLTMDEYNFRRTVDSILTGTFLMTQTIGRMMRELGGGVILNIGPRQSTEVGGERAAYLSAKAGVVALTKVAAHELAEHNIRVNVVSPGADLAAAVAVCLDLCTGTDTGQTVDLEP